MPAMDKTMGTLAVIGVGGCGMNMLKSWVGRLPVESHLFAIGRDEKSMAKEVVFSQKFLLTKTFTSGQTRPLQSNDQKQVETSMREQMPALITALKDQDTIILLAGLGGGIGTWATQFACNHLLSVGKEVVTVLVMPFGFERGRVKVAEASLSGFDGAAHRVLCFNDCLIKHAPEHTSFEEALEIMNEKAFELLELFE